MHSDPFHRPPLPRTARAVTAALRKNSLTRALLVGALAATAVLAVLNSPPPAAHARIAVASVRTPHGQTPEHSTAPRATSHGPARPARAHVTVADAVRQPAVDLPVFLPAGLTREQRANAALIEQVFPAAVAADAVRVAYCESRLRSVRGSRNSDGTYDYGVFQINDGGTLAAFGGTPATALNPRWNVRTAYRYWRQAGWRPWTCRRVLR